MYTYTKQQEESEKLSWGKILNAVIQAIIAAITALGVTSCAKLI